MKKILLVLLLLLVPVGLSASSLENVRQGAYYNMYPNKNYYYNFAANGRYADANLHNIDNARDKGFGDVYLQGFNDYSGSWATQCSQQDRYVLFDQTISCYTNNLPSFYYDLRAKGHYDYIVDGDYLYSNIY